MERTVDQGFTEFLSRITPLASQREAAAKHRLSVDTALKKALVISTSWETGSFHHGTGVIALIAHHQRGSQRLGSGDQAEGEANKGLA